MEFDPDAYLAGAGPSGFDPDSYLGAQASPQAPAPTQGGGVGQAVTDRLRYINDVMTLGGYDRLVGAARSAMGGPSFQQASQEEIAKTQAARQGLSTGEQIGYGLLGSVPLAAAGGVVGTLGRGLSSLGAESAGAALSRAASTAAPTLAQRAGVGAVEVGAQGAAEAAIRGQDISGGAATGAGVGAALPVALSGVGRVISPIARQLTPPQVRLAEEARARGLELTPAQATGSRAAQFFESQLRDLPGGGMSPRLQQQQQLQQKVLQEAGVDAPFATPEAIASGFQGIGKTFDDVLAGRSIQLDDKFGDSVLSSFNRYNNRLDANVRPIFKSQVEGLLSEGRAIDGVRAGVLRSDLATLERQYKGDPSLKSAIGGLRRAVDEAIDKSLPKAQVETLRRAREQYKNLSRVDEVMSRAGPQGESGMIPFSQLNNLIKQRQGSISRGVSAASPEMATLSQIGSQFFREPPSSGTAQRNYINALLTGGIGAGSFVAGGIPGLAAAVGTPLATNAIYNTPLVRQWLSQQAGRRLEDVPQRFLAGGGQAGLGLLGE
jgi:hypothetical protein